MYNNIYGYRYSIPAEDPFTGIGMGIMMIYIIAMLLIGIISLASYILRGIGLYTIAKHRGYEYAWLAFIPFFRIYLQGKLSGDITFKNKTMRDTGIWLAAIPLMYGVVVSGIYGVMCLCGMLAIFSMTMHVSAGRILILIMLLILALVIGLGYKGLYKTLRIMVNYQIYCNMTSVNMAVAHAVLGALLPLYESICFFVMRNREQSNNNETHDADSTEDKEEEQKTEEPQEEMPIANETVSFDTGDSDEVASDNEITEF